MDHPRPCGCKGCRTCLICEKEYGIKEKSFVTDYQNFPKHTFCYKCNRLYPGEDVETIIINHPEHNGVNGIDFPGVLIEPDFLSENEENMLMEGIDNLKWDISQSGRRKQNYGPKTNFKKMKLALGQFKGFPEFSRFIQDKLRRVPLLETFQTIEQCSLEYDPTKGASIDPHIDDCWIWGGRVVTVNCLSDSILTLTRYSGDPNRYNLPLVQQYQASLISPVETDENMDKFNNMLIQLPMPRRSLIIMYGAPRYQFEHSVLRKHILTRRVCVAYREFTPMYLPGGCRYSEGEPVLEKAKLFWNEFENE